MRALLVATAALSSLINAACEPPGTRSHQEHGYLTEEVSIGDIRDIVPAVGPLRAATQVDVGAEVSGRILEVHADFNDPVETGQLLARIDPAPFHSALAQARAQRAIAEAEVRDALAELNRARQERMRLSQLVERGAGREAELTDLEFRIEALEARVQRARAAAELADSRVSNAEIDLSRTEIRAPVDGFVLDRRIEQGQAVNAVQSAPTLFVVTSDLDEVFIEAAVSEADIGRIDPEMNVRFSVDAFPAQYFQGEIEAIRRAPIRSGRFVSYAVIVAAENPFGQLLPGMTASVEFVRADARSVLRIPAEALYYVPQEFTPDIPQAVLERFTADRGPLPEDPEARRAVLTGLAVGRLFTQGKRRVFVLDEDGVLHAREVRLGGEDQTHLEVTEGLAEGETVVLADMD